MRLVYLSPVPWASFAQRPHKFVEWFHSRRGGEVLWIDPYPARLPQLADIRRLQGVVKSTLRLTTTANMPPWLTVIRPRSLPIEPLPGINRFNRVLWRNLLLTIHSFVNQGECQVVIAKPSELALQVLARHPGVHSTFDAMDDFPAFHSGLSRMAMAKLEREVADRVTRISVSSTALADRFDVHNSKLTLALNACSTETLPPLSATVNNSIRSVLGYVGTIGHWFDWPLVFSLAEAHTSMYIRLIGPVYAGPQRPLLHNMELLPACDHATAIRAMGDFSVGLIPFKLNDLTASVDPIKYYEYRALGLPVLSTRFGEMALRTEEAGVFIVEKHTDLAVLVKNALEVEFNFSEIQHFRNINSWRARFDASYPLP